MQIQVHSDHNIDGHQGLATHVKTVVENALGRFVDRITRVEVHLSDENSHKSGPKDKRCVMEARPQNLQPIAVTHHAATVDQAVDGAAGKLARLVESTLARRQDRQIRHSEPSPAEE